jgi:hypothetical protein
MTDQTPANPYTDQCEAHVARTFVGEVRKEQNVTDRPHPLGMLLGYHEAQHLADVVERTLVEPEVEMVGANDYGSDEGRDAVAKRKAAEEAEVRMTGDSKTEDGSEPMSFGAALRKAFGLSPEEAARPRLSFDDIISGNIPDPIPASPSWRPPLAEEEPISFSGVGSSTDPGAFTAADEIDQSEAQALGAVLEGYDVLSELVERVGPHETLTISISRSDLRTDYTEADADQSPDEDDDDPGATLEDRLADFTAADLQAELTRRAYPEGKPRPTLKFPEEVTPEDRAVRSAAGALRAILDERSPVEVAARREVEVAATALLDALGAEELALAQRAKEERTERQAAADSLAAAHLEVVDAEGVFGSGRRLSSAVQDAVRLLKK